MKCVRCSLLQRNSLKTNCTSIIVIPYFYFSVSWVLKRIILRDDAAEKKAMQPLDAQGVVFEKEMLVLL